MHQISILLEIYNIRRIKYQVHPRWERIIEQINEDINRTSSSLKFKSLNFLRVSSFLHFCTRNATIKSIRYCKGNILKAILVNTYTLINITSELVAENYMQIVEQHVQGKILFALLLQSSKRIGLSKQRRITIACFSLSQVSVYKVIYLAFMYFQIGTHYAWFYLCFIMYHCINIWCQIKIYIQQCSY